MAGSSVPWWASDRMARGCESPASQERIRARESPCGVVRQCSSDCPGRLAAARASLWSEQLEQPEPDAQLLQSVVMSHLPG